MRVKTLILGVAVACLAQPFALVPTMAQTDKPAASKPEPPQGRVGSLSPDEARRAERSRRRAAGASKSTEASKPRDEAKPGEAARPRDDAKPREAAKEAPPRRETVERAAPKREARPALVVRKAPQRARAAPERDTARQDAPAPRSVRAPESRPRRYVERPEPQPPRLARRMWRRDYAGRPAYWRPRVGSYVPRGVPLYALPPRFRYGYGYPGPFYRVGGDPPPPVYGRPVFPGDRPEIGGDREP